MTINYRRLNLPKTPLKDTFTLNHTGSDMYYIFKNVDEVLQDDLLTFFKNINIKPNMVVICASNYNTRTLENIWVHRDLYWKNNKWEKPICGINYELGNTSSKIYWFDTTKCYEIVPKNIENIDYPFNAISYVKRHTDDLPIGAEIIETVELTKDEHPILFRTEVAHGVAYNSDISPRLMATIRFDIDDIPSWNKALEIFSPYFI